MGWVGRVWLFLLLLFFVFLLAFIFGVAVVAVCLFVCLFVCLCVCLFFLVDFSFQPFLVFLWRYIVTFLKKFSSLLSFLYLHYFVAFEFMFMSCMFILKKKKNPKKNKNVSLANWRCVKASFLLRLSDNSNLIFG